MDSRLRTAIGILAGLAMCVLIVYGSISIYHKCTVQYVYLCEANSENVSLTGRWANYTEGNQPTWYYRWHTVGTMKNESNFVVYIEQVNYRARPQVSFRLEPGESYSIRMSATDSFIIYEILTTGVPARREIIRANIICDGKLDGPVERRHIY